MDLHDYWEENKRFVGGVALALAVFLVAHAALSSVYADDIVAKEREIRSRTRDLAQPMYGAADLAEAETENEALRRAVEELTAATHFVPRERFRLDPARGAASSQYLRALSTVRDELLPRANRANLRLDGALGMPSLSPTREAEIERYLEALDVVDALVGLAIDAGVQRVDQIRIDLDPGLRTRKGLGAVERTRVTFVLVGSSLALERVLTWTQRPPRSGDDAGRPLHVHALELLPSRSKAEEVRLELVLAIARVRAAGAGATADQEGGS